MKVLYKRDTTGKIRSWGLELDGDKYRTYSGLVDGSLTISGWTVAVAKRGTTPEQQAALEVAADYKKKLALNYFETLAEIDNETFFEPMLAHKYEKWQGVCYSQPKLDGIRCIAKKDGLWSRKGKPFVAVPHIMQVLQGFFKDYPDAVLDGELYNHDLRSDFNKICSVVKKMKPDAADLTVSAGLIQYHIYDIWTPDSHGFDVRTVMLRNLIISKEPIVLVPTSLASSETELDQMYGVYLGFGYEGQIVRNQTGVYENKRSNNLLKRKEFKDGEFKILAVEEGLGNWAGVAKKVVLELPDGREFGAGIKGNREDALILLNDRDKYIGKMATVRYFTETPDGIPRFPVVYNMDRRA